MSLKVIALPLIETLKAGLKRNRLPISSRACSSVNRCERMSPVPTISVPCPTCLSASKEMLLMTRGRVLEVLTSQSKRWPSRVDAVVYLLAKQNDAKRPLPFFPNTARGEPSTPGGGSESGPSAPNALEHLQGHALAVVLNLELPAL